MAQFRALKTQLRAALAGDDWQTAAAPILQEYGRQTVGALFSFLLLGGAMTGRAALCLGEVVAKMADEDKESARVIMRRFMWHMNEESGNIGWGIPEAMASCLVAHEGLAKEFHRILLSYIRNRDGDSNYCDYAPLRRHCFWSVGFFVQARPELVAQSGLVSALIDALIAGLTDEDEACRVYAAWALSVCVPALKRVCPETEINTIYTDTQKDAIQNGLASLAQNPAIIEFFKDGHMQKYAAADIAQQAMTV